MATEILDRIAEIESHLSAISLLTDQIVALSGKTDEKSKEELNILDTARIATQRSAEDLTKKLGY